MQVLLVVRQLFYKEVVVLEHNKERTYDMLEVDIYDSRVNEVL